MLLCRNNSCLLEIFKGSTEPKILGQLLEQAGFPYKSNITTNGYDNNAEMPWINRFLLGGLYNPNNRSNPLSSHSDDKNCYFTLTQNQGNTALHYAFNVAAGHWEFKNKKKDNCDNCIQIHLPQKLRS